MRSYLKAVALDSITFDLRVQRTEGVDQRRVDKIAANFDPAALGLFILSERKDGTLVGLDGMHRCFGARKAGYTELVEARIFVGLSLAEEASLFLMYNDKKDPSAISKYNARVISGDPVFEDIDSILRSHGWEVANRSEPGFISCPLKVEVVYRKGAGSVPPGEHPDLLDTVLYIITGAWKHDPKSVHQAILGGVGQLVGRFGSTIDTRKLITEMASTQPETLISKARVLADVQRGTTDSALAKVLTGMHNSRRRTNLLPDWVWYR